MVVVFLSDENDYRWGDKLYDMVKRVKAKPFNRDFKKQIGYFNDCDLLHIDIDKLSYRLNNYTVDFKNKEYNRALKILENRLRLLKGVAWE